MLNLLLSVFILGLIIMIHEFGHFLFAKLFGVGVVEFAIGMGPVLVSHVFGETRYSLSLLPFGGSCMMVGEEEEEEEEDTEDDAERQNRIQTACKAGKDSAENSGAEKSGAKAGVGMSRDKQNLAASSRTNHEAVSSRTISIDGREYPASSQFVNKPAWQRFLVIFAGPLFNFLLALLLSLILTGQVGADRPYVMQLEEGMPAKEAGLETGDLITGIAIGNGQTKPILTSRDLMLYLTVHAPAMNAETQVRLRYTRAGKAQNPDGLDRTAVLTPAYSENTQSYRLGLSYDSTYRPVEGFPALVRFSAHNVMFTIDSTVQSLRMMVRGQVGRKDVMGPVRMVQTMDETVTEAADYGLRTAVLTMMNLVILISGSLGAMNLLPIPALDGGRLVFILIELIFRRPVPRRLESRIHAVGMALLLTLMAVILFNDVTMLFQK